MPQTIRLDSRYSRQEAHRVIDAAPAGYVVTVKEPKRSTAQNDRFWAMLSDVSRAKPEGRAHTPEAWKELFMHACGWESRFAQGLNGEFFPVGFRSSQLTVRQMTELMDFIDAWGTERGVVWTERQQVDA
jgi:hypothetical protein